MGLSVRGGGSQQRLWGKRWGTKCVRARIWMDAIAVSTPETLDFMRHSGSRGGCVFARGQEFNSSAERRLRYERYRRGMRNGAV